ncbi:GDSL-type esterase/lipase family protein [Domibacillus sp. PGB-M46]|uniref:GDSL-type esterase/lipase family protein n=1 Tax=Domibacillus sp. PGB-M46 TaxID=2910255 RepID=UPI001F565200|nr:GDSL-type esterase/lipase family protein [Domibacillus sp. PGB-M46]MCI2253877.1 GDSL-type esterase/lipase family protein [Domibacillus sp. PGB-M46]
MKKILSVLLSAGLALSLGPVSSASAAEYKLDYVALGDSIAVGQMHDGTFGNGYTDMIGTKLASEGVLDTFNKNYAASGQTTGQLLDKLKLASVQESIKEAELVTISIGANDFIQVAKQPGTLSSNEAINLITKVKTNVDQAVSQIQALNPKAKIYLFGYYFPLPHYAEGVTKDNLRLAFNLFNNSLKSVATTRQINFVEVAPIFQLNERAYLLNANDIHPTEAGYQVFYNQFFKQYSIPYATIFPSPSSSWGKTIKKAAVAPTKAWTIQLSKQVDPDTVKGSIYIVKDGETRIAVTPTVSSDKRSITIKAPAGGYTKGSYHLLVTEDLKDLFGNSLNTTVSMTFAIQ